MKFSYRLCALVIISVARINGRVPTTHIEDKPTSDKERPTINDVIASAFCKACCNASDFTKCREKFCQNGADPCKDIRINIPKSSVEEEKIIPKENNDNSNKGNVAL